MDTLLEVKDLCKQYKGAGNYMAVYHMNLSIPRGKKLSDFWDLTDVVRPL